MLEYFDINDIEANETKVMVQFPDDLKLLSKFYPKNTRVELPLFIAKFFIENENCKFDVETLMSVQQVNDILADPAGYNLNTVLCPKFSNSSIERTLVTNFYDTFECVKHSCMISLSYVFCTRMSVYLKICYLESLDETILAKMDVKERSIILKARKQYAIFNNLS
ncbi:hypothetical protein EDEG_02347 [Edhazardia aedis USNM 41457]|uniref:DNA replication complex GINS protein PSF3 n=1 Tax=Edhazardia aedis (strain USNM 41457) TaxID=1003232 RepID=J9D661_EDHAE|nr:hypothetical protein EDEG_02347 [Edhazardia aedis USNM 41457]|eukprot:EJW03281.1 hypothetical protein EDEG_02347 [Edhazardia aedis USNM 41457]